MDTRIGEIAKMMANEDTKVPKTGHGPVSPAFLGQLDGFPTDFVSLARVPRKVSQIGTACRHLAMDHLAVVFFLRVPFAGLSKPNFHTPICPREKEAHL